MNDKDMIINKAGSKHAVFFMMVYLEIVFNYRNIVCIIIHTSVKDNDLVLDEKIVLGVGHLWLSMARETVFHETSVFTTPTI